MFKPDQLMLLVCLPLVVLLNGQSGLAQETGEPGVSPVQLRGKVLDRQKYQFTVGQDGREHAVRMSREATVALRLNKPFFRWADGKVFVQPVSPADEAVKTDAEASGDVPRVAFRLPGEPLNLIARFRTPAQMKRVMKAKQPRINYYLLTTGPVEPHWPSEDELFIAGRLEIPDDHPAEEQSVTIAVGDRKVTIRLGFRTATLDGFHIGDLEAGSTEVMVVGQREPESGVIVADRVLFEPRAPGSEP